MAEIIVLSDSNESVSSIENFSHKINDERNRNKDTLNDSDLNDFEFPEVHFHHSYDANKVSESDNNTNENYSSNVNFDKLESTFCKSLYENYDKCENIFLTSDKNSKYERAKKCLFRASTSSDSIEELGKEKEKRKTRKGLQLTLKKNKNQLIEERLKKQKQLIREKALKKIVLKKSKNIKPGECMKFIEVVLDKGIENFDFSIDITSTLQDAKIQYSIDSELIPNSITWKRSIENSYVNEINEICTEIDIEKVNRTLVIWNWDEVVTKLADDSFYSTISSIKSLLPNHNLILVIYCIEDYFIYRKQTKNTSKGGTKSKTQKTNNKSNYKYKNAPEISRQKFEMCLNEIQVITGCSSRLLNNPQDLAQMVYQCTKSIAEIPYKLEKNKNLVSKFDWYVMGDNRNTVRVDKDGNGLKRLWQQQLCQFNLSSLEIAEAICSVYSSPIDLIKAYKNCAHNEGINLLKDIPIRRAAGPLTIMRKVGPELSKKIYTMFTSRNGENILT